MPSVLKAVPLRKEDANSKFMSMQILLRWLGGSVAGESEADPNGD